LTAAPGGETITLPEAEGPGSPGRSWRQAPAEERDEEMLHERFLDVSRAAGRAAAATAIVLLTWGCSSQLPYTPNDGLVDTLGVEEAKKRIAHVLQRAIKPHITTVRATDDYVQYFWEKMAPETFYDPLYVANVTEVHYATLTQVKVFDDFRVTFAGPLAEPVDEIRFGTDEDARTFADLLLSFKAKKAPKPVARS
jgi:hypothetical protein